MEEIKKPLRNGVVKDQSSNSYHWMKLSSYVQSLRPWSFGTSLMPVALGGVLAYKVSGEASLSIFLVTCFTALCVHAAGNLVNTYYDFVKGIDSKKSDDRTLVDHILSKDEVVHFGAVLYGAGCLGFVILAMLSPARMEHLALMYFGGLSSSFLYTGGIGLKYIALGDVLVLIIFGPITLLFSYMAQSGSLSWAGLLYAVPLALGVEAVLHSNNTRDLEHDRSAGIVTLAILLGPKLSRVLFAVLLFLPYIMMAVSALHSSYWLLLPLLSLPRAFALEKEMRSLSSSLLTLPQRCAQLMLLFHALYVLSVWLCDRSLLPFLSV